MTIKEFKDILNSAHDDAEIKIENGEITIIEPKPIEYKFKVGDKVWFKAIDQICTVEKVIDYLSPPAYEVSGWDGILPETAFEPAPLDITERIKTFEDACEWCNENGFQKLTDALTPTMQSTCDADILAYLKLRIIVAALNEGWEPSKKYPGWMPRWMESEYCNLDAAACHECLGNYALKLGLKSEKLAIYAKEQFHDIYADFCRVNQQ